MSEQTKFSIDKKTIGKVNCLYLNGYLDAHTAPELETAIGDIIDSGNNRIVVNFSDLDYISSAGLGVFMAFIENVRETGGDIKLVEMKPKVFSVFDLLGFPLLFDIENNQENALRKFNDQENENANV